MFTLVIGGAVGLAVIALVVGSVALNRARKTPLIRLRHLRLKDLPKE